MKRRTLLAGSFLLMLAIVRSGVAGEPAPEANDHAAMAAMYTSEAEALRQKVAAHEVMLRRYESAAKFPKTMPPPSANLVQHCRKLIASYGEAAANAEALGKMEAELARSDAVAR